jgi:MFS family permease
MRRIELFALVAANAVSLLGNTIAAIAIPWFVLITTGSAAQTGIAAFVTTLPLAAGAFFGGAVADRLGHRRTSIVSDLLSAGAIAGIPVLHAAGMLELWHVFLLAFLGALFDAPGQAAREALLPDAADGAGIARERANSLWTTAEHVGYVFGAPLAGVTIALAGAPAALWLDAASFVLCAATIALAAPRIDRAARDRHGRGLIDGLRYIASSSTLVTFFVLASVGNFLIAPLGSVLLPVYARESLAGAESLAILIGAYGAGGLVGAAGYGIVATRVSRTTLFTAIWLVYAPGCAVLVALPPVEVAAVALFAIGILAGSTGPLEQLVRQEHTPAELRGRVFATFMASITATVPPAMLIAGLVVEAAGLRAAFVCLTLGNAALTAAAFRYARPRLYAATSAA